MIIAIDGPAGAGKSSIARQLAHRLEFQFLDTGAMYRAITLACLQDAIDLHDNDAIAFCAERCELNVAGDSIWLNEVEVSELIRTPEVSGSIWAIADNLQVRQRLVQQQRTIVGDRDFVTEGRDQATVAFPNAECKIFLTALPLERAMRRKNQLAAVGIELPIEQVLADQERRDAEDTQRRHGGLRVAADAIYVHTDGLEEEQVLTRLIQLVNAANRHTSALDR